MSIRSITVQYVGDVLFLPKLERDVKLVVERDYGSTDPDKRFVMEQSESNRESRWFELFGTPERAARTLAKACGECSEAFPCCECPLYPIVGNNVYEPEILEWLRGEGED